MGKRSRDRSETHKESVEYCVLAASQLAYEAHLLSCLDHPNIVKMRGLDADGILGFEKRDHRGFFLLMDILSETLDQKIDRWRSETAIAAANHRNHRRHHQHNNVLGYEQESVMLRRHKDKLGICLQLTSALEYLHDRRIVYRDLKPSNIGFVTDRRNHSPQADTAATTIVQLFDFGLSRELTPNAPTLTGAIGTMRYMAPEVCLDSSYDCDCDIYSYAIVCWELWTQKVPFEEVATPDLYRDQVCQRGYRPVYRPEKEELQRHDPRYPPHHHRQLPIQAVPQEILVLLSQAWKHDPRDRIRWSKTRNQLTLLETLVSLQLEEREIAKSTAAAARATATARANANTNASTDASGRPSFDHYGHVHHGHVQNNAYGNINDREVIIVDDDDEDNDSHFSIREEDLTKDLGI